MRILFFSPHNPYPPSSGFHRRQLEILSGFREIGCQTHLASTQFDQSRRWHDHAIQYIRINLTDSVQVFQPSQWDRLVWRLPKFHPVTLKYFPKSYYILTPPNYRAWFRRLIDQVTPDLIWMNHAYYDGLLNHRVLRNISTAIDIHDLVSVNRKMWRATSSLYKPSAYIPLETVDDRLLREDFITKQNFQADDWEFKLYDQYSYTVSINQQETDLLRRNTQRTRVVHIPMSMQLSPTASDYSGLAIFPTGDNPYNVQGYFYFIKKVLPIILKDAEDFRLQVTGYCSAERVSPANGVMLSGYLPELVSSYLTARFLVCPVIGGTGQLVKVIEAMSYGLPAVILRQAASRAPVRHNENGFIAQNAHEFAEYVLYLWQNQDACRRMGESAREIIAENYSMSHLNHELSKILSKQKDG